MKQFFLLSLALYLFSCKNDNIGVSPSASYAEGDVTGILSNNTPYHEHFRFDQLGSTVEKFEEVPGGLTIQLTRSSGGDAPSHITISLLLKDLGMPGESLSFVDHNDQIADEFDFYLANPSQSNPATLIELKCIGFANEEGVRSMSLEANKVYNFVTDQYGEPIVVKSTVIAIPLLGHVEWGTKQNDIQFLNTAGDTIQFEVISNYYDYVSSAPFNKIVYANGGTGADDNTYRNLIFGFNSGVPQNQFLQKQSDGSTINLKEYWSTPNGSGNILNYSYDYTTGHLTFAFSIEISDLGAGFESLNSTMHDLVITGKFDSGPGKIYHP